MRTPLFLSTLCLAWGDIFALKAFEHKPEAFLFAGLSLVSLGLLYALAKPLFPRP